MPKNPALLEAGDDNKIKEKSGLYKQWAGRECILVQSRK